MVALRGPDGQPDQCDQSGVHGTTWFASYGTTRRVVSGGLVVRPSNDRHGISGGQRVRGSWGVAGMAECRSSLPSTTSVSLYCHGAWPTSAATQTSTRPTGHASGRSRSSTHRARSVPKPRSTWRPSPNRNVQEPDATVGMFFDLLGLHPQGVIANAASGPGRPAPTATPPREARVRLTAPSSRTGCTRHARDVVCEIRTGA